MHSSSTEIILAETISKEQFKQIKKSHYSWSLLPAFLGTIIEYYDYALYGVFALTLSRHFFPEDNTTISLIKTFGIFIAGSFSKPFGAILFGYLGDTYGRSTTLKITLLGIAIPTMLIGLIPGYDSIGLFAPLTLLICRILQGIFVIGEYEGVRIFVFETVGRHRPNFAMAIINVCTMLGIYFAFMTASVINTLQLPAWSWRIPFVMSGALGLVIFLLRSMLKETPDFINHQQKTMTFIVQNHIFNIFPSIFNNYKNMLKTILRFGSNGGIYHFYFIFYGVFLSSIIKILDPKLATHYSTYALLIYTLSMPFAGWCIDYVGDRIILKYASILLCLNISLHFYYIQNGMIPLWAILLTASNLSFFNAPGVIRLLESFPIHERYRCLSLSHALGSLIFSGTTPLVCLTLYHVTQWGWIPLLYCSFLIFIGFISVFDYNKLPSNKTTRT